MGTVFGKIDAERPVHQTLAAGESYEIRCFDRLLAAEVVCKEENRGFNALARYVAESQVRKDGGAKFGAMTTPLHVETEPFPSPFVRTALFMPARFKELKELPAPSSEDVKLVELPPTCYAVKTFPGPSWGDNIKDRERELRDALTTDGVVITATDSQPKLWRYNPPWTLSFYRTNEIVFRIDNAQAAAAKLAALTAAKKQNTAAEPVKS
jgi:hypothetical protein